MRTLFVACVGLCAFLGVVHIGFTFVNYDHLSPGAVWFAGTGFALLLLAALNWSVVGDPHPNAQMHRLAFSLDVLMVVFGLVAVRAVPEPQAYVLLAAFLGMAVGGWLLDRAVPARPHRDQAT